MRKRLIIQIVLMLVVAAFSVSAQSSTGTITGAASIISEGPASGATVLLKDTKIGTVTDLKGRFEIKNVPAGSYEIVIRLIGYSQNTASIAEVKNGETVNIDLVLRQSAVELHMVEVSASRRQSTDDLRVSVSSVTPREAKYLPGAAEDVLRSLQSLPGVLATSDFSSQLTIRGSGPDQNLIAIDGFEVLNPYRLYGFISMFNPETVSEISLQTGGFSAKYGDRLSAVLDVRNREGRPENGFSGKINSSITNANLIFEGAAPFGGSWIVSARRTYYDLIAGPVLRATKAVDGDVALPNFRDIQAKAALPISENSKLLFNWVTSRDGVKLTSGTERNRPDSINVFDESYNTLYGLTWQFTPTPKVVAQSQVSWYRNSGIGAFDGTLIDPAQNTGNLQRADTLGIRFFNFGLNYDYRYTKITTAQNIVWLIGKHSIEFGGGVDLLTTERIRTFHYDDLFRNFLLTRGVALPIDVTTTISYYRMNGYLQDRLEVFPNLFFQPGLRFDYYSMMQKSYLAPRVNLSYAVDPITTVRIAYGIYYQSPGMDKQDNRASLNYTETTFRSLEAEHADHFILGLDRMVTSDWQFKAETYLKKFDNLIVPQKLSGSQWVTGRTGGDPFTRAGWSIPVRQSRDSLTSTPVNDAVGNSYGVEFMLQKITASAADRISGWISYALAYAERDRDGVQSPFLFDQRHAINVVGLYKLSEKWELGMNFALRSGRPYAKALGVKPRIVMQKVNGIDVPVVQIDPDGKVVLDVEQERDSYSSRLNVYHSLDIRLTTYPEWCGLHWSVYIDVTNIYNHRNEQQISYFVAKDGSVGTRKIYGLPIFPALGMSLSF